MATPPPPAVVAEMRIALALAASASAARWPFTSDPLDFWAGGGKLFVSSGAASARLHLKGVSWFGFETSTACVHELWAHSLDAKRGLRGVVCSSGGERRIRPVRGSARRVPQRRRDTAVPAAVQGLVQSAVAHDRVPDLWVRGLRGL